MIAAGFGTATAEVQADCPATIARIRSAGEVDDSNEESVVADLSAAFSSLNWWDSTEDAHGWARACAALVAFAAAVPSLAEALESMAVAQLQRGAPTAVAWNDETPQRLVLASTRAAFSTVEAADQLLVAAASVTPGRRRGTGPYRPVWSAAP